MDKYIIGSLIATLLVSCSPNSTEHSDKRIDVMHNNFILIGDLSNRLEGNKPLYDTIIINTIIDKYWSEEVLYQNRKLGHQDKMLFKRIQNNAWFSSDGEIDRIDLGAFGNDNFNRNRYIKNLDTMLNLDNDRQRFKKTIALQYQNRSKFSGYINGVLNGLGEEYLPVSKYLKGDSTANIYHYSRDIVVIFTDGYIEFGRYGKGMNSLSGRQIKEIRNEMLATNSNAIEASFNLGYEIAALNNKGIVGTEFYLLETNDRSYTNGNPTAQPDDRNIYSSIWKDWLERSGAKSVVIKEPFRTRMDAAKFVDQYLLPKKSI